MDENRQNFKFSPKILRISDFDVVLVNCEKKETIMTYTRNVKYIAAKFLS